MATFSEMLRDFGDMLDEAYHGIDSGLAGRLALSRSAGFRLSSRLVQSNSFFKTADSIAKEAKRIQKAIEMSSRFPEKYSAPHRYIEFEDKQRQRNRQAFQRSQEVRDKILSIENPEAYHKIQLVRRYGATEAGKLIKAENIERIAKEQKLWMDKEMSITDPERYKKRRYWDEYGWFGSQKILAAEQNERIRLAKIEIANRKAAGRYAYSRATMSDYDRTFHDLTMQYGSGEQGRRLASEKIQSDRDKMMSDLSRNRRLAVMREGLDDYQRFIHENKGKYGREGAEQVFRQRLLKELPPFFKNSKMSTQQLINISKMMKSTSGIPIVGTLVNHPIFAAIGALTAAAMAFGKGTVGAIKETMPWVLGEMVGGQVSERYKQSVAGVGVGEGEAIKLANRRKMMIAGWQRGIGLDAWTRGAMFGVFPTGRMMSMNQEELVDYVSAKAMNIQDEGMRMQALSSYGVSHEDYVASLQRQGLAKKTNQNYIYQIAQRAKDERDKRISKGGWAWKILQPDWIIDFLAASSISDPTNGDYYKKILDNSIKTEEASESLKDTESSGGGINTTNTTNNSHAIYISNLNVSADNPQSLIDQLYQMSGGNTYGENRAILASMGSGVIS